jgi:hypothetical protein
MLGVVVRVGFARVFVVVGVEVGGKELWWLLVVLESLVVDLLVSTMLRDRRHV